MYQEREREGLLEKVASLESATHDNVKLAQKVAHLEAQVGDDKVKARFCFLCLTVKRFFETNETFVLEGRCGAAGQGGLFCQR